MKSSEQNAYLRCFKMFPDTGWSYIGQRQRSNDQRKWQH